jgi:hypothetical protein
MYQPIAPLQPAEDEDPQQLRHERRFDLAPQPEVEERQQEDDADQPPQNAVPVLPEKDALELVERHLVIDLLVFRRLLVLLEGRRPIPPDRAAG